MCRWYSWLHQGRQGRGGPLEGRSRQQRLLQGRSQGKTGKALQVDQQRLGLVSMARLRKWVPLEAYQSVLKARDEKGIGQGSDMRGIWTPAADTH